MGLASSWSVALLGLEGRIVEVEADIGAGLPRTVMVGLPDTALYESRDRCKAAIGNSGHRWPDRLVTINLSPAALPKAGAHYDLAVVAAVLAADDVLPEAQLAGTVFLGELSLDGRLRPVRGLLPALLAASRAGFRRAVVPQQQAGEAALVGELEVFGIATLTQLIALFRGEPVPEAAPDEPHPESAAVEDGEPLDLFDVVGQPEARWALEVAAAGRHHLGMLGPPGVGKTMLAERLPGLLPRLSVAEALEVSALHSLAGRPLESGLIRVPPYADPHHSASMVSIVGGGPRIAKPGAVSLAHRGVLFLDEAPEFPSKVLDSLRTPLESGTVSIWRSENQTRYPARFQLVLASNPCPCGLAATPGARCRCAPQAIRRYREKVSEPIRDRLDLQITLLPIRRALLDAALAQRETTAAVAERVQEARERQRHRLRGTGWSCNGEVAGPYLRGRLPLPDGTELIDRASESGRLSARGVDKVLRVAWTLADLDGCDVPNRAHVRTALALRSGDPSADGRAVSSELVESWLDTPAVLPGGISAAEDVATEPGAAFDESWAPVEEALP
ncbi:magnesium chelatase family protein [Friedmanniella endophytica]|uniref:Magnesium chelatase family protein n=1 Tax=Microlunatus kandeliicorticis TaxID=1759536 RepID=A0A7W3P779_9ACTN|nr:magnesium chelatase family protein [Microlunatus kandeliicorticis]